MWYTIKYPRFESSKNPKKILFAFCNSAPIAGWRFYEKNMESRIEFNLEAA